MALPQSSLHKRSWLAHQGKLEVRKYPYLVRVHALLWNCGLVESGEEGCSAVEGPA